MPFVSFYPGEDELKVVQKSVVMIGIKILSALFIMPQKEGSTMLFNC